jgi:hypothetical protein
VVCEVVLRAHGLRVVVGDVDGSSGSRHCVGGGCLVFGLVFECGENGKVGVERVR